VTTLYYTKILSVDSQDLKQGPQWYNLEPGSHVIKVTCQKKIYEKEKLVNQDWPIITMSVILEPGRVYVLSVDNKDWFVGRFLPTIKEIRPHSVAWKPGSEGKSTPTLSFFDDDKPFDFGFKAPETPGYKVFVPFID
jgi:hypothetical protein